MRPTDDVTTLAEVAKNDPIIGVFRDAREAIERMVATATSDARSHDPQAAAMLRALFEGLDREVKAMAAALDAARRRFP